MINDDKVQPTHSASKPETTPGLAAPDQDATDQDARAINESALDESAQQLGRDIDRTHDEDRPWPDKVYAITLFIADVERSSAFYRGVFGLPVHYQDDHCVVFDIAGFIVNLLKRSAVPELIEPATMASEGTGPHTVLSILVQDVDTATAAAVAGGATVLNGPMDRPWGIRTSSFRDPDGHIWEIAR